MKQDLLQKQGLLQLAWHDGRSLHAAFAFAPDDTGLYAATAAPSSPRPSAPARRIFFLVVMPETWHKLISGVGSSTLVRVIEPLYVGPAQLLRANDSLLSPLQVVAPTYSVPSVQPPILFLATTPETVKDQLMAYSLEVPRTLRSQVWRCGLD